MDTSTPMPHHKLVIIGAGLSGLTLARCLLAKSKPNALPVLLVEREPSPTSLSYGITLQPRVCETLRGILSLSPGAFASQVGIGNTERSKGSDTVPGVQRVNRGKLQALLRENVDISWDHQLVSATRDEASGAHQLTFENGKTISADTVVGADGVHSQLRKCYAPSVEPKVLPYVVYNGKRHVPVDEFQKLFKPAFRNGPGPIEVKTVHHLLRVSINEYCSDHVSINYTLSRPAKPNDDMHQPQRGTAGAKDIPEAFFLEVQGMESLEQPFSCIFDPGAMWRDRLLHWLMRDLPHDNEIMIDLAKHGIMMIGDSAHATPILGGNGANVAIEDAARLATILSDVDQESNFKGFLEEGSATWKKEVEESEVNIERMHNFIEAAL